MNTNNFGERLKFVRSVTGLSQAGLAKQAGSSRSMISSYEAGLRLPRGATLLRLAKALGVSAQWLMEGEGAMEARDWMTSQPHLETAIQLPHPLHEQLQKAAVANHQSMSTEIVARLEASFRGDEKLGVILEGLTHPQIATLRDLVGYIKASAITPK